FVHFDGKIECGIGPDGGKMLLDVFGTPDEDRPVRLGPEGGVNHFGKEYLRQILIQMGYFDDLKRARRETGQDLPYPVLPPDVIQEASTRYLVFADAYSAGV